MESKTKQEKQAKEASKIRKVTTKKDYVTHDHLEDFEKRIETKLCYELKAVKFELLRWMIPFHMTTLAFMLTMLYRIFAHG
ncbi:hypothetical protein [Cysteiniphilum sp. 6C5]|uniref:hypothetical protein n=1 Tax=unclassified Cysteiniphilum TaxID=2610889 RepID=UPI003F8727AC